MDFLIEPLSEPFMRRSLLMVVVIAVAAGIMGSWMVLYGYSYAGESIAHSAFPGIALAATAGLPVIVGGIPAVALAALLIGLLASSPGVNRDTAVAVTVIGFFGIGGLVALAPGVPVGVDRLLFGDLLATSGADLITAAVAVAVVGLAHLILRGRLLAVGFDPAYSRSMGVRASRHEIGLLVLLAVTVLIGVQALGNLLIVALLVAPATAAMQLTRDHSRVVSGAVVLAALAGAIGLYLSYYVGTAAGASVAAVAIAMYLAAIGAGAGLRARGPKLLDRRTAA